jgi:hypothetical protein
MTNAANFWEADLVRPGPVNPTQQPAAQSVAPTAVPDWAANEIVAPAPPPPAAEKPADVPWHSMLTGAGRVGEDAPELGSIPMDPLSGGDWTKRLKMTLGQLVSADEKQLQDIAIATLPGAKPVQDRFGNPMVEWQGQRYYANRPGMSEQDITKLVGDVVAFGKAGKGAEIAKSFLGRIGLGGLIAGGVSVGQDAAAMALGSKQGISGTRAAETAVGGAAAEALMPVASKVSTYIRNIASPRPIVDDAGNLTAFGRGVFERIGVDASAYTAAQLREISNLARSASGNVDQAAAQAVGTVRGGEFNIPRTEGQRTGSTAQLNLEDSMRYGGLGDTAQKRFQEFDATQREAVGTAVEGVRRRISGSELPRDEAEIGQVLQGAVRQTDAQTRAATNAAYDRVGELGQAANSGADLLSATADATGGLRVAVKDALNDVIIDDTMAGTKTILKAIDDATIRSETKAGVEAVPSAAGGVVTARSQAPGELVMKDLPIGEFERIRRNINTRLNDPAVKNSADGVALTRIKNSMDKWLDDTVESGLFKGDQETIDLLKTARGVARERAGFFSPQDAATRVQTMIEKALSRDATGQEMFNAVYGAGQIGTADGTKAALQHLAKMYGTDSPVFMALREGAVRRMVQGTKEDVPSYRMMAKRINETLTGDGKEVALFLFRPAERAELLRLRDELQMLDRTTTKQNASGTAYKASQLVGQAIRMAVGEGAGQLAGATPGVGSIVGGIAARGVGEVVGGARANTAIRRGEAAPVFSEMPMNELVRLSLRGGIAGAANQ